MLFVQDEAIREALRYDKLVDALRTMFQSDYQMPLRHHHFYKSQSGEENALILMPTWNDTYMGVKQVTVAPNNASLGLPAIFAQYTLMETQTGKPLAQMNAAELTSRRTACTSALAASYLARPDVKKLLVVGGGGVARHLVQAHAVVRQYEEIGVWMRNPEKLKAFVENLQAQGYPVVAVNELEAFAREADVISCATLSKTAIIKGDWVKEGAHLDLIGSHKPDTREVDDDAIRKSSIFVDSRMGALHETGELAIPIAQGILKEEEVKADIRELTLGQHAGRSSASEITLFKSAGLAIEDLAAALLVYQEVSGK